MLRIIGKGCEIIAAGLLLAGAIVFGLACVLMPAIF